MPDPHSRFTVSAGVSIGSPARNPTCRAPYKASPEVCCAFPNNDVIEFLGSIPARSIAPFAAIGRQLLRGKVLQLAAIAAKGRPRPADDGNVPRLQHDFLGRTPTRTDPNRLAKLVSLAAREQI